MNLTIFCAVAALKGPRCSIRPSLLTNESKSNGVASMHLYAILGVVHVVATVTCSCYSILLYFHGSASIYYIIYIYNIIYLFRLICIY